MIFNSEICPVLKNTNVSPVVSVEGNLGSGKTTFLKLLADNVPGLSLMKEPV